MKYTARPDSPLSAGQQPNGDVRITKARGLAVLNSPFLNKGTAFTGEERKYLGLTGLLPPVIGTLDSQSEGAYLQYQRLPDAVSKNIYLTTLHDRNELLFDGLFSDHLREMIPIINDLTVGMAIEQYHHECRRPRGLYLSIDHPGGIEEAFDDLGLEPNGIDLILATDGEKILGMGDLGIGAIEVAIGKLAIYTAAGGIAPRRVVPVMLDVGTDRESLLTDPIHIGNRHARIRGSRYDAFIEAYIEAATRRFPHALLQWEDLAPANARRIHETYGSRICTFNDDMEGTDAIALAAVISADRVRSARLRDQRVVILGFGTAGVGIAGQRAMVRDGLSVEAAVLRFWLVDRQGLLIAGMDGELGDHQKLYARPASERWKTDHHGYGPGLAEVVSKVKPSLLIGAASVPGAFTEAIVRDMAAHTARPIIFPLSMPAARAEASPSDLIAWTNGRALVATGGLFGPVTYQRVTYAVGQLSNSMVYPGLAQGVAVVRAFRVSEGMLWAAASAVSSMVAVSQPGASLVPHVDNLRTVSMTVAAAVADAAQAEGLATVARGDIVQRLRDAMWQPEYERILAA